MKILFDTTVLIAAFIARGACSELFEHCLSEHRIYISQWILREFSRNLLKKFGFSKNETGRAINFLKKNFNIITTPPLKSPVCSDPDDDKILAVAIHENVDCIIAGDNDLLRLKIFKGIPILKPSDFWKFEKE